MVKRELTPDITQQICFVSQLTGFYITRGFTELYFLTYYICFLENHFYFENTLEHYFKPSLSSIFCVNTSVKVLPP